jgi:[1-hydroxy-2-(trimethylamino)ethyl]phosphonate dioxygenase
MANVFDEIDRLFGERGDESYFGEQVSLTQHSLQAAYFAHEQGAARSVVLAALLHDIGHLLEPVAAELADWTVDAEHERIGERWLLGRFGAAIALPVGLHVAAKRYLCATDAGYFGQLSPASVHTLELQGGPMSAAEAREFAQRGGIAEAIQVRRCDDQGKVAGLAVPPLAAYRALIEAHALSR